MKPFRDWICTAASAVLAVSAAFAQPEDGLVPGESEDVEFPPCVDLTGGALAPRNILGTFGPLADLPIDGSATPPDTSYDPDSGSFYHRGVTYRPIDPTSFVVVIGGSFGMDLGFPELFYERPITRYVKTPLLAALTMPDSPYVGVEMVFDEPTPLIGFGFGFNDAERQTDGRLSGPVGWVTLYNEDEQRIRTRPLFASRLLCCTEGEFEYVARQPEQRRLLVKRLVARITEDYTPFDPQTGQPGEEAMKFFGVDWVRYQRTEDVPECPPVDP